MRNQPSTLNFDHLNVALHYLKFKSKNKNKTLETKLMQNEFFNDHTFTS